MKISSIKKICCFNLCEFEYCDIDITELTFTSTEASKFSI